MIEIGYLEERDIGTIIAVGGDAEHGMESFWRTLLEEPVDDRLILVARDSSGVAGYVHLKWRSKHRPFAEAGIPEISDLRVAPSMLRRGVATALIARCEELARERGHKTIGIGVGLYADYGPAQRLYFKLGYAPDGTGATHGTVAATPGEMVRMDDDLVLWLAKDLSEARPPLDVASPRA